MTMSLREGPRRARISMLALTWTVFGLWRKRGNGSVQPDGPDNGRCLGGDVR